MSSQPLSDRQAAVLAAVRRLGRPSMIELRDVFPDHAPSEIRRVLEALERRQRVASAGDPDEVYVGGVRWWSSAPGDARVPERLTALWETLEREAPALERWVDLQGRAIVVLVPLGSDEAVLEGLPLPATRAIRAALEAARRRGLSVGLEAVGIRLRDERCMELRLTAP